MGWFNHQLVILGTKNCNKNDSLTDELNEFLDFRYTFRYSNKQQSKKLVSCQLSFFENRVLKGYLLGQWLNFKLFWDYIFRRENQVVQTFFFQGPGRLSECMKFSHIFTQNPQNSVPLGVESSGFPGSFAKKWGP